MSKYNNCEHLKSSITKDIQESAAFGYANAVPLPYQKSDICIEKIDMLDTEYAAMLEDVPKF